MTNQNQIKTVLKEISRDAVNYDAITIEETMQLIFGNLDLLLPSADYIRQRKEMYYYNPRIFYIGGTPGVNFHLPLGAMLDLWNEGHLVEENSSATSLTTGGSTAGSVSQSELLTTGVSSTRPERMQKRYVYHCGGSFLSGEVYKCKSYCIESGEHSDEIISGVLKRYLSAVKEYSEVNEIRNVSVVEVVTEIPQRQAGGKTVEIPVQAHTYERVMSSAVDTLPLKEIISILKEKANEI